MKCAAFAGARIVGWIGPLFIYIFSYILSAWGVVMGMCLVYTRVNILFVVRKWLHLYLYASILRRFGLCLRMFQQACRAQHRLWCLFDAAGSGRIISGGI